MEEKESRRYHRERIENDMMSPPIEMENIEGRAGCREKKGSVWEILSFKILLKHPNQDVL